MAQTDGSAFDAAFQVEIDALGGIEAHGQAVVFVAVLDLTARSSGFHIASFPACLALSAFAAMSTTGVTARLLFAHEGIDRESIERGGCSFRCRLVCFNGAFEIVERFVPVD